MSMTRPPEPATVAVRPPVSAQPPTATRSLVEEFAEGLDAPICLTWELTYACNLSCVHCLSSSGRRDPHELSTEECFAVIDELERLQVFYVNIGGGEPMLRPDFFEILEYAAAHHVGVKFSTNGTFIDAAAARRLAAMDYLDIQISIDGADPDVNDAVRGEGSFAAARAAMDHLRDAGVRPVQDLAGGDPPQRRPARRLQGHRGRVRGAAPGDAPSAIGPGRGHLARAAPHPGAAARAVPLADGPTRCADRRLVLPPVCAGRSVARTQPVRRRAAWCA